MHPHDHPATRYANAVADGEIAAGKLVRLAAQRHLTDLTNARERGWVFDLDKATRPANFARTFRHAKGYLQGSPFQPLPWQEFVLGCCYGWVSEETGLRRFRIGYNQVAKKNGKTTLAGVPAAYGLLVDGEGEPDIFAAATAMTQARLLFNAVKSMLRSSPWSSFVEITTHEIRCPQNGGTIRALTREASTADGSNPSLAVIDEVHLMPDGELPEILRLSMIARAQPMQWMITTAGSSRASYCGTQREYAEDILTGKIENDQFFAFVTEPDVEGEIDILDPLLHEQANPSLGHAFPHSELISFAKKALQVPSEIPSFKRFHLNLWTAGGETWIPDDVWMRGASSALTLDMLHGRKCWAGLDLSSVNDTTAFVIACPLDDGRIALWRWIFLPIDRLIPNGDKDKVDYQGFRDAGLLEATPGDVIDYAFTAEKMLQVADLVDIQEIACDPAMMKNIYNQPGIDRLPLVEHRQNTMAMSPAMKEFERRAHSGELVHTGDQLMRGQVANVVVSPDAAGNIYPNKRKATGRIDAPVAAIMALGRTVDQGGVGTVVDDDYWSFSD